MNFQEFLLLDRLIQLYILLLDGHDIYVAQFNIGQWLRLRESFLR